MVKIVTDSLSDITSDMARGLGITIVPLTVSFGRESFLEARSRYYKIRGLDETGRATKEKAEELGLAWNNS